MTKLLLSSLACLAFVATTSVFADDANPNPNPDQPNVPQEQNQQEQLQQPQQ